MTTPTRHTVLKANEAIRRGNGAKPRKLPDGEVVFRIPQEDWTQLMETHPDLMHPDPDLRMAAWRKLRHSDIGEKYLVVRPPNRVILTSDRVIIR